MLTFFKGLPRVISAMLISSIFAGLSFSFSPWLGVPLTLLLAIKQRRAVNYWKNRIWPVWRLDFLSWVLIILIILTLSSGISAALSSFVTPFLTPPFILINVFVCLPLSIHEYYKILRRDPDRKLWYRLHIVLCIVVLFLCAAAIGVVANIAATGVAAGAANEIAAVIGSAAITPTTAQEWNTGSKVLQIIAILVPTLTTIILTMHILFTSIYKIRKEVNLRCWYICCILLTVASIGASVYCYLISSFLLPSVVISSIIITTTCLFLDNLTFKFHKHTLFMVFGLVQLVLVFSIFRPIENTRGNDSRRKMMMLFAYSSMLNFFCSIKLVQDWYIEIQRKIIEGKDWELKPNLKDTRICAVKVSSFVAFFIGVITVIYFTVESIPIVTSSLMVILEVLYVCLIYTTHKYQISLKRVHAKIVAYALSVFSLCLIFPLRHYGSFNSGFAATRAITAVLFVVISLATHISVLITPIIFMNIRRRF